MSRVNQCQEMAGGSNYTPKIAALASHKRVKKRPLCQQNKERLQRRREHGHSSQRCLQPLLVSYPSSQELTTTPPWATHSQAKMQILRGGKDQDLCSSIILQLGGKWQAERKRNINKIWPMRASLGVIPASLSQEESPKKMQWKGCKN